MNKKNIIFTIILFMMFLTASILALLAAKKITIIPTKAINTPDFFIVNAIYTKFDQNGNISNQLYTDKIVHFSEKNSYTFDKLHIKIHNSNEQPWEITANKGKSEYGKSKIYLWDDVKIVQKNSSSNHNLIKIYTSRLSVYPDNKFAETDQPITIIQGENIAKAIGAEANFKTGVVNLLSNIEGRYQTE